MANLTSINDRLTPSVPTEITFAAQKLATGRKMTTLLGHVAASGVTATPYQVYTVVNAGDPDAAKAEVDALAGSGSQIGKMAEAFVKANSAAGGVNFPAFRVVMIPNAQLVFGPNDEALLAIKALRNDMIVSCYGAQSTTARNKLKDLCSLLSGVDRNLQGQFGSFFTVGSIEALSAQVLYAINSRFCEVATLPDTNTALIPIVGTVTADSQNITAITRTAIILTGDLTSASQIVTDISSTADLYVGAAVSAASGIAVGTVIDAILSATSIRISIAATSTEANESLTITNLPTAGIYEGATLSGTGITAGTTVESVAASTIVMSAVATATGAAEMIGVQNVISQPAEIVAAAHAGRQIGSAFPYNPLQGVTIGGLIAPRKSSDHIDWDPSGASEQALIAGLSPLYVQPGLTVGFVRTRTTYNLLPDNVSAVTSYFDWQELVTLNDFKESVYLITQQPPFNNNPGGTKASLDIAAKLKDEVLREAFSYETRGAFQGVKTLAPLFLVQPSATARGRFDFKIPVNVLPGLFVIAGNIEAQSDLGNFTL